MRCPSCDSRAYCVDSRVNQNNITRRKYNCRKCGYKFNTREIMCDVNNTGKKPFRGIIIDNDKVEELADKLADLQIDLYDLQSGE